jgi:hypothetical protein
MKKTRGMMDEVAKDLTRLFFKFKDAVRNIWKRKRKREGYILGNSSQGAPRTSQSGSLNFILGRT